MKNVIVILALTVIPTVLFGQSWLWNKQMESNGLNRPVSTVFKNNKIYYVGEFLESFSFDGQGLSSSGLRDVFIAGLTDDADLEWITRIGGAGTDWVSGIKIGESGNLFVSGSIGAGASFSGSAVSHSDGYDAYAAKYSPTGNLLWAKNLVWGTNLQMVLGHSVDFEENLLITGYFIDEAYFGDISNPGTCIHDVDSGINVFVAKFDTDGNLIWRKVFASDNDARFQTVETFNNDIYVGGFFRGNLTSLTDTFTSYTAAFDDILLLKLNSSGDIIWTREIGGSNHDRINKINADESGNIYVNGYHKSSDLLFESAEELFTPNTQPYWGNYDFLIAKYSGAGDLVWSDVNGGTGNDTYINSDIKNGKIILTGVFTGQLVFGTDTINASGVNTNSFFTVYDLQGNVVKSKFIDGPDAADRGATCSIDDNGNYYLGSFIKSTTLLVGDEMVENINPGVGNSLLVKFGCFDELTITSTPVTCVDGMGIPYSNDGTAGATPVGGDGPFSFIWSNGAITSNIAGLDVGNYTVTVSDISGCSVAGSVSVGFLPAVSVSVVETNNVSCNGAADGSAVVTGVNGSSPYSYNWSNGASSANLGPVGPGTYSVTVTDQCGNMAVTSVVITEPAPISITIGQYCTPKFECEGWAQAIANGGTAPYTYAWSNGGNTPIITDLCKGQYYVTATDANGCMSSGAHKANIKWCVGSITAYELVDDPTVYPNPTSGGITIDVGNSVIGVLNVRIFDIIGKEVYQDSYSMDFQNKITINLESLPVGIYHGDIQLGESLKTFRFSVSR